MKIPEGMPDKTPYIARALSLLLRKAENVNDFQNSDGVDEKQEGEPDFAVVSCGTPEGYDFPWDCPSGE
jgi:hypothetical protein